MFDRFILASNADRINSRFQRVLCNSILNYEPCYNISPAGSSCVIINDNTNGIHLFKFGMQVKNQSLTFIRAEGDRNKNDDPDYAGSKAIFLKPEFSKIIRKQRCLVLADAFVVGIDNKSPYVVYLRNKKRPFAFAGIWDKYLDEQNGDEVNSFAIITVPANKLLQQLNQRRMPVILDEKFENRWLNKTASLSEVLNMLNPFPSELMNAYPISNKIQDVTLNDKSLVAPMGKPICEETSYQIMGLPRRKKAGNPITSTLGERINFNNSNFS